MTSAIDPLKPITGTPTTQSVRDNFSVAKSEIEFLQGATGFADYNDTATTGSPIAVSSSTWTKLTNNALGTNTIKKLPSGVTDLWNSSTNQLALSGLPLYSQVESRIDLVVTTSGANQTVQIRTKLAIGDGIEFALPASEAFFKTAGAHTVIVNIPFYIGSAPVQANPGEFQIFSDASCTVKVNGWYMRASKFTG
jgi:hypothetical protein